MARKDEMIRKIKESMVNGMHLYADGGGLLENTETQEKKPVSETQEAVDLTEVRDDDSIEIPLADEPSLESTPETTAEPATDEDDKFNNPPKGYWIPNRQQSISEQMEELEELVEMMMSAEHPDVIRGYVVQIKMLADVCAKSVSDLCESFSHGDATRLQIVEEVDKVMRETRISESSEFRRELEDLLEKYAIGWDDLKVFLN